MEIPLVDLKTQYFSIKSEIDEAVGKVLSATAFIGGKFVEEFEKEFSALTQTKYAVAVANGTDALYLGLRALGISRGDEVITPPFTFIATAEAIERAGASVVFADIDERTFNVHPSEIEKKITRKTRAIMPVHIFGQAADMDAINAVAKKHKLAVFEDACQAHGALWNNKPAGTLGKCAAFSFYPSKNLGAYGDGGAFTTNDANLARTMYLLRDHGRKGRYLHTVRGVNSRLDAVQAAILAVKLRYLKKWNESRRKAAEMYYSLFADTPKIVTPAVDSRAYHVYHVYGVLVPKRAKVVDKLKENGVNVGVHYPLPVHLQPAFKHLNIKRGSYPVSERISKSIISLPIYPEITEQQIEYVAETLKKIVKQI
ncbi:MAG: DegT/DnrJ/EryC1/StrS family aminotransferase [Planctomycetota bacterium]